MTVHATAIAHRSVSGWRAVVLFGPSGAGKSDLALRMIRDPAWRLVGDDRLHLWRSGEGLYAAPAKRLAGILEVRHIGLMAVPHLVAAQVGLIVRCETPTERLPEPDTQIVHGVSIPRVVLEATDVSTPDRIRQTLTGIEARSWLEP
ncbi:MAG: serine kinase [Caulobacterales bacterium]|nr:serine kinase [Caulobacterales bacterium]